MSDYLFTSTKQPERRLSNLIKGIYFNSAPVCTEYHGAWGSLAVSQSHYNGFMPYENERHICIVIGAPVLYFLDNTFLTQPDSNKGTQAIYSRWTQQSMNWADDLSGPFTALLIDKKVHNISIITDLMAFVPVYSNIIGKSLFLGTHVDALAKAAEQENELDETSLADFILNDVITFPYTAYANLRQELPGSITTFSATNNKTINTYWQPTEEHAFRNIKDAALSLRHGIKRYTDTVTENMHTIAQFISAGEDSRALSGLLPQDEPRDAYIFLDSMNREGKIAQKVAKAYGVNFIVGYRDPLHYLHIMPEASALVGLGHQYSHAHSLGFDKEFDLPRYDAVFGGYLADSLLKGAYAPKLRGSERFPFLPDITVNKSPVAARFGQLGRYIKNDLRNTIIERQQNHLNWVKKTRPNSANEWFVLYPASMRIAIPNFYSTRRLFKSYEPFLSHEVVKIAAQIPTQWKLNRKLFHKAMKPFLEQSQWILHADGRLPYYPWWLNMPLQASIWFTRQISRRVFRRKGNEGPWGDWNTVFTSKESKTQFDKFANAGLLDEIFQGTPTCTTLVNANTIKYQQKANLMQSLQNIKNRDS